MWRQHYDIHTYRQTDIHTDRQTEPKYDIDAKYWTASLLKISYLSEEKKTTKQNRNIRDVAHSLRLTFCCFYVEGIGQGHV